MRGTRAAVVVPTYNERENILPLLDALLALPITDLTVLVVDDSSPDGTADLVRERARTESRVRLIVRRRKKGYGRATSEGFLELLALSSPPDVILQMDADFSFDPGDVPRLFAAIEKADLVIGSRYCPGGRILRWHTARRIFSVTANTFARRITRVPIHDLTGGFNAWRTALLRAIRPETIRAEGYGYLVEAKVRASRRGARITEIPITFTERREGKSKLSRRVIVEAALTVLRLGVSSR